MGTSIRIVPGMLTLACVALASTAEAQVVSHNQRRAALTRCGGRPQISVERLPLDVLFAAEFERLGKVAGRHDTDDHVTLGAILPVPTMNTGERRDVVAVTGVAGVLLVERFRVAFGSRLRLAVQLVVDGRRGRP